MSKYEHIIVPQGIKRDVNYSSGGGVEEGELLYLKETDKNMLNTYKKDLIPLRQKIQKLSNK